MTRFVFVALSVFAIACGGSEPDIKRLRLASSGAGCPDPIEVCQATEPPVCFDVCVDEDEWGGDEPCVSALDSDGNEVSVCGDDDCVVSIDTEGNESLECPPFEGDDGGA